MSVQDAQQTPDSDTGNVPSVAKAKLYVIHGSHACRTAVLALNHKGIAFETVVLPTGAHPMAVRALGFPGHRKPIRSVDGQTHAALARLDRMGTVPALRYGEQRIQTNTEIIRFLDGVRPNPPLYPADPALRERVEEARVWGDEPLQMAARRIVLASGVQGPSTLYGGGAHGRLGALLSENGLMRTAVSNIAARVTFRATGEREAAQLAALPEMLDRIDAWIGEGVLNAAEPNAADFTIAPSLALLSYRLDIRPRIEARPCYALMERFVPEDGKA
jgi:glutathione S-transferase